MNERQGTIHRPNTIDMRRGQRHNVQLRYPYGGRHRCLVKSTTHEHVLRLVERLTRTDTRKRVSLRGL